MRNALLFDDILQFTDFVRVYGADATSSQGFTLYQVRDPQRPSRTQLILLGFRRRKSWSFESNPLIMQELQVDEKDGQLSMRRESGDKQELDIQGKSEARTLVGLIDLQPWKVEPPRGRLLFWLHRPELMSRLVTDSFRLENDRIQFSSIQRGEETELLLRIDSPSYYLLQWCHEQHPEEIDIFYTPCEDMFVQWGYQHPLESLWRRAAGQPRKQEWIFFFAHGPREHIQPPQWQDIYKATEFVFDFPSDERWTTAEQSPVRFRLPLRFEPRSRPLEPELWMLEQEEQHLLERLLSLVDEEDLKALLISIQESEDGRRRFFIREKHTEKGRKFLDFKGQRFASYKGFYNLLLPVSIELQPQLRRDQYRDLFDLQSGQLTVVTLAYDDEKDTHRLDDVHILKIAENSFSPLSRMIDYIVESNVEQLSALLKQSIFDFGHYARAPRRGDLLDRPTQQKEKDEEAPTKGEAKAEKPQQGERSAASAKGAESRKKITLTKQQEEAKEVEVVEASELEKQEETAERALVHEGQSPDRWQVLADLKAVMKKWSDACTCGFENLWLMSSGPEFDDEVTRLTGFLDRFLGLTGTPAQRLKKAETSLGKGNEDPDPFAVAAYIFHGRNEGEDRIASWLQQATQILRATEPRLRKKERWLLWREIFLRNADSREQARIREDILQDLNTNGITNHDVPLFIQERLFQERWLQQDDDTARSEVGAAYRNLEMIAETVHTFPIDRLRAPGLAVLARAFARIGHHPRSKELLDAARKGMEKLELDTQAWIMLYTFQAIGFQSKSESQNFQSEYQKTCKELEKKNRNQLVALQKMETSLEERKELENLSEYLSKENHKRLFPSNPSSANNSIKMRLDAIESSYQAGELENVRKEVLSVLQYIQDELNKTKKAPEFRTLAWLLGSAIATLSKLKWGNKGRELVHEFESFVNAVPNQPPEDNVKLSDFYFTLLHLAMAEGLIALGSEPLAIQHMQSMLSWTFERDLVPLDYVDMCSRALNSIEVAQLKNRQESLKLIMKGMHRQVSAPQSMVSYDNASFAAIALRLLDQIVEVALSKEKLTLGLYKRYADQDELLIRERIFTEDVCKR